MLRLVHSDNICTVGWTSIHAWMSPDDMRFLKQESPEGHFSGTCIDSGNCHTPEDAQAALDKNNERRKRIGMRDMRETFGFYFSFPLDSKGIQLLSKLGYDATKCKFYDRRPIEL